MFNERNQLHTKRQRNKFRHALKKTRKYVVKALTNASIIFEYLKVLFFG